MATLAFTLIGHNEAHNLPRTLESIRWADEIVYVDCESSDGSAEVARAYTSQVFTRPNLINLNVNKQYAIDQARSDWVFYLDADEAISADLAAELRALLAAAPAEHAFKLPRRNRFFGRWLRHGGQYPDMQLRLFRRGRARFPCRHVHERLDVDGAVGELREAMDHYTCETVAVAVRKMDFNSTFNAQEMARAGLRPGWRIALRFLVQKPLSRFLRRYLLKGGFRDGWPGLIVAAIDSIDFPFRLFKFWDYASHPERLPTPAAAPAPHAKGGAP
jgi:glycosyltransferase involved in cell wall biosynthesis